MKFINKNIILTSTFTFFTILSYCQSKKSADGYFVEKSGTYSMVFNKDFKPVVSKKFKHINLFNYKNGKLKYILFSNHEYGKTKGVMDISGNILIQERENNYEPSQSEKNNTFIFTNSNGKKGIMDEKLNTILAPIYDNIYSNFLNKYDENNALSYIEIGYTLVKTNKIGLIDSDLKEILKIEHDELSDYFNFILAKKNGKYAILNQNGKFLSTYIFDRFHEPIEDYIKVEVNNKYGLLKKDGTFHINAIYTKLQKISKNEIIVSNESKMGLISIKNEKILECKYDSVWIKSYPREYVFCKENKSIGVFNLKSKFYIPPQYEEIHDFNSSFEPGLIIKKDGKFGIIDFENKLIFNPTFDSISNEFRLKKFIIKRDSKWGLFDINKNKILDFNFERISIWNDSLTLAFDKENSFIFNKKEKVFKTILYDDLAPRFEGGNFKPNVIKNYVDFKINNKWGRLKMNGSIQFNANYDGFYPASSNGNICYIYNGKFGLMDSTENVLIEPKYDNQIDGHNENLAEVKKGKYSGLINYKAKKISKFIYDKIIVYGEIALTELKGKKGILDKNCIEILIPSADEIEIDEKYSTLKKDGKYAYFNNYNGKMISGYDFDSKYVFYQGLCPVVKKGLYGLIDSTGKYIVLHKYDDMVNLGDNFFKVKKIDNWGLINSKGLLIIPINYSSEIMGLDKTGLVYLNSNCNFIQVAKFSDSEVKFGIFNKLGVEILPCIFKEIRPISNGFLVDSTGKLSFYNNEFLKFFVEEINSNYIEINKRLLGLKENDSYRIFDTIENKFISKNSFEALVFNSENLEFGLIFYKLNSKWGLISINGFLIGNPIYDKIYFENNLIFAHLNSKIGKIDIKGDFIENK